MSKIAVLVSGSGSNMKRLFEAGIPIDCVISDRDCSALMYAKEQGVDVLNVGRVDVSEHILAFLKTRSISLVVLAGFLSILSPDLIRQYTMINIHPSLLPKYGGRGMYGMHVHHAVFAAKDKESGCTVHYVNEGVDTGPIIAQSKVDILDVISAQEIQERVLLKEWELLPRVVKQLLGL